MNLPIQSIPISYTNVQGEKNFMILEAPNGDSPFEIIVLRFDVRGKYRDKNTTLRRRYDKFSVSWVYDYRSHLMDLRKLLTAVDITLSAPPNFVGSYQSHPVVLRNSEAVKNWLEGLPVGGGNAVSFDTMPSGGVALEFEIKTPLEWEEVLELQTMQKPVNPLEVPIELEVDIDVQDVQFNWNNVFGLSGYNLYLDSGAGFVKHNDSLITTNEYLIEDLAVGSYSAYVQGIADTLEGVQSNTAEFDVSLDVEFQSASDLTITIATTVNSTIPGDVLPGDFMVLHLMHRSALTPPAGWTLIETSATVHTTTQRQTAMYRVAQAGDESSVVTSTQASSARFLSHIQVFRSSGTISVIDNDTAVSAAAGLNLPEIPSTGVGQMAVVSMTNVFAATGQEIAAPAGYTQTTLPVGIQDKRLACGYKKLSHPETISGRFQLTTSGSDDTNRTAGSIILGVV